MADRVFVLLLHDVIRPNKKKIERDNKKKTVKIQIRKRGKCSSLSGTGREMSRCLRQGHACLPGILKGVKSSRGPGKIKQHQLLFAIHSAHVDRRFISGHTRGHSGTATAAGLY